jgi:kinesin family protein 6/9
VDNPLINERREEEKAPEVAPVLTHEVDEDALAYINARKKVTQLQKARKVGR